MYNYPDNTWVGDPRAPWNESDNLNELKCKDCCFFKQIPEEVCDTTIGFCTYWEEFPDGEENACEKFEDWYLQ